MFHRKINGDGAGLACQEVFPACLAVSIIYEIVALLNGAPSFCFRTQTERVTTQSQLVSTHRAQVATEYFIIMFMSTSMMHVPPEILQMIFACLEKLDLKSSRLARKAWNAEIPPLLFNSVFVTARYADLEVAEKVASRFGRYVETLVYSPEVFEKLQYDEYIEREADEEEDDEHDEEDDDEEDDDEEDDDEEDDDEEDDDEEDDDEEDDDEEHDAWEDEDNSWPSCYMAHTKQHYETYVRLEKEQREILETGEVFKQLCRAFKSMPNISRVILAHSWNKRAKCWCEQAATDAQRRSHKPWNAIKACQDKDCDSVRYHQGRCVTSLAPYYTPKKSIDWWKDLMRALDKSDKALPELVVEATDNEDARVQAEVFKPSHGLTKIMPCVFAKLTRLELCLDLTREGHDLHYGHAWRSESFSQAFSAAKNLESLHISLVVDNWEWVHRSEPTETDFRALFTGCSFPKLHTLSLDRCTATEEEIPEFLRKSPDLRCLVFERFTLNGFWIPLVQSIRDNSQVKILQLNWVRGKFDEDEETGYLDVEELQLEPDLLEFFHRDKGSVLSQQDRRNISKTVRIHEQICAV